MLVLPLEPYTVFTHVDWEGARGSTLVGLHVIVLQDPLNGDTVVWKLCVVSDCIGTFDETKI